MGLARAVLIVACLGNGMFALYPVDNCPKTISSSKSFEDQCTQLAECLRVRSIHMYLNSIYFNELDNMANNDEVLNFFCSKLEHFDDAILESVEYLSNIGCSHGDRVIFDKDDRPIIMKSFLEFWKMNRRYLHSVYTVVCTRFQNEVCPNDNFMLYVYDFARCFHNATVDSWNMFPVTSSNTSRVCKSVKRLKDCVDVHALDKACGGTPQAESVIGMNEHVGKIAEMANCD